MRGANKHPPHRLGARWPSLLSPSRGRRWSSSLVVGRLSFQVTAVIVSPPRPRHAHAGRRTPADHRTPTAADHRPQTAARRCWRRHPPPKHPPPPFSLSPVRAPLATVTSAATLSPPSTPLSPPAKSPALEAAPLPLMRPPSPPRDVFCRSSVCSEAGGGAARLTRKGGRTPPRHDESERGGARGVRG